MIWKSGQVETWPTVLEATPLEKWYGWNCTNRILEATPLPLVYLHRGQISQSSWIPSVEGLRGFNDPPGVELLCFPSSWSLQLHCGNLPIHVSLTLISIKGRCRIFFFRWKRMGWSSLQHIRWWRVHLQRRWRVFHHESSCWWKQCLLSSGKSH